MLTGLSLAVNLARKKKLAQTDKKHICTRCSLSITSPIYPLKIIIQKHCKNKKNILVQADFFICPPPQKKS